MVGFKPMPSCPVSFRPQHQRVLSDGLPAQVCPPPTASGMAPVGQAPQSAGQVEQDSLLVHLPSPQRTGPQSSGQLSELSDGLQMASPQSQRSVEALMGNGEFAVPMPAPSWP